MKVLIKSAPEIITKAKRVYFYPGERSIRSKIYKHPKKDISKLIPKKIVDKTGKVTTVWVRPGPPTALSRPLSLFRQDIINRLIDYGFDNVEAFNENPKVVEIGNWEKTTYPIRIDGIPFNYNIWQHPEGGYYEALTLRWTPVEPENPDEIQDIAVNFAKYLHNIGKGNYSHIPLADIGKKKYLSQGKIDLVREGAIEAIKKFNK